MTLSLRVFGGCLAGQRPLLLQPFTANGVGVPTVVVPAAQRANRITTLATTAKLCVPTRNQFQRICVFRESNPGHKKVFSDAAVELGNELVSRNIDLVYSGGSVGLMGLISQRVFDRGCNVLGVIPKTLVPIEDNIIPRLSFGSLERLRNEIIQTDWVTVFKKEDWKRFVGLVTNAKQMVSSVQHVA